MLTADHDTALDTRNTGNTSEMQSEAEERTLHIMAKVQDSLRMSQSRQNICATPKVSRTQNSQMAAVELVLVSKEIFKLSW
jgi:hypothetical protein